MYQRMIPGLLARHRAYYDSQRSTLRRYRDLYEVAFWKGVEGAAAPAEAVEVADANSWIEGFVASLFSKAPAVRVGGSIRPGDGKDSVAEAVLNAFLYDQQSVFTNGTRASLIFPMKSPGSGTALRACQARPRAMAASLCPLAPRTDSGASPASGRARARSSDTTP